MVRGTNSKPWSGGGSRRRGGKGKKVNVQKLGSKRMVKGLNA